LIDDTSALCTPITYLSEGADKIKSSARAESALSHEFEYKQWQETMSWQTKEGTILKKERVGVGMSLVVPATRDARKVQGIFFPKVSDARFKDSHNQSRSLEEYMTSLEYIWALSVLESSSK
jgi:hypothetical protein